jgi:hypothetical protein
MRQIMAKQARRELRRAMGIGALDTIQQQDQATAMLSVAVGDCQRDIASLIDFRQRYLRPGGDLATLIAEQNSLLERQEPLRRPFLGRLRWLFLGK